MDHSEVLATDRAEIVRRVPIDDRHRLTADVDFEIEHTNRRKRRVLHTTRVVCVTGNEITGQSPAVRPETDQLEAEVRQPTSASLKKLTRRCSLFTILKTGESMRMCSSTSAR